MHPPEPTDAHALLPARIRRLSNAEYDGAVQALLGTQLQPSHNFAPDARQAGFTENEAQQIDAVRAKQFALAADKLAAEARGHLDQLAPCAEPAASEPCAREFIERFGARAYRRPVLAEEASGLLAVFHAGARDGGYAGGIELVLRALLQSAGFLYLTELGDAASAQPKNAVTLTQNELASELAFLITGAPPDRALLEAASRGELAVPDARRSQLRRLRAEHPHSRDRLVRLLRQWLQIDAIENTAKDIAQYPSYELMWRHFIDESYAFIGAVLDRKAAAESDLHTLLAADWTVGQKDLAEFYESKAEADGRIPLAKRRGVLNQGAFLSVQAHARTSAPVLRGTVIARRLACIAVPAPATLGLNVLPPPPDPKLTTRQRYDLHSTNPVCADCHAKIDDFGYTFEHYDGMGRMRDTENGADIDSASEVAVGADFDGQYADSNALAEALAKSPRVRECFARYVFRAASAHSSDSSGSVDSASEDAFIREWQTLPDSARGNVMDTLEAYVASPLFTHRRTAAP